MFAVFQTGGKQYKVAKDEVLTVERLAGTPGDTVAFDSVLMLGDGDKTTVGAPFVAGATVAAEIVDQSRGPKIIVFKKKRRKNYRRRNGHRQDLTLLRVTEILTDGKKPTMKKAAPKPQPVEDKPAEDKSAKAEAKPEKAEKKAAEAEKVAPEKAATPAPDEAEAEVEAIQPEGLSAPEGEADDLKKITGLGPKAAEGLNQMGIFHYRQLAALTPENVAWVEEELNLRGRITRDDWVGQAKTLAAETD